MMQWLGSQRSQHIVLLEWRVIWRKNNNNNNYFVFICGCQRASQFFPQLHTHTAKYGILRIIISCWFQIAVKWQHIPFCHKQQRILLARKALELNSRGLISCEIPSLFHFCCWLLQKRSDNFLLFFAQCNSQQLEGSVGLLLAGMLAKLVSENSGKGIFWGFSEVVVGFVCFVLIAIPLEERKKTAVPGKYWGVEASLSCLPPSADFGAFDISWDCEGGGRPLRVPQWRWKKNTAEP